MYADNTISNYLNALASKTPAPGGGSAAALVGALGAALLGKVANFTLGKEKYKNVEEKMREILDRAKALSDEFNKLCSDDAAAYEKLSEAFKMPKDNVGAHCNVPLLEKALKDATEVPFSVCKKSLEGINLCLPAAKKGNTNLITDVGDAGFMFECAFRAALLNVEINLKDIKDKEFTGKTEKLLKAMEKEISAANKEIKNIVKGKIRGKRDK